MAVVVAASVVVVVQSVLQICASNLSALVQVVPVPVTKSLLRVCVPATPHKDVEHSDHAVHSVCWKGQRLANVVVAAVVVVVAAGLVMIMGPTVVGTPEQGIPLQALKSPSTRALKAVCHFTREQSLSGFQKRATAPADPVSEKALLSLQVSFSPTMSTPSLPAKSS